MEDKINQIIGKKLLRNLHPGINLEVVKKQEGAPKREVNSFAFYLEYQIKIADGEDLKVYYYYDDKTKIILRIELFYHFFPSKHDEDSSAFLSLKEEVVSRYSKDYGTPEEEVLGSGKKKETYLYWTLSEKETSRRITLTDYKDLNRKYPRYSKDVLKIVYRSI